MFTIKTPGNPQYTGIRSGIAIVDGVGKTEDEKIAVELKALGYEVEPDPTPKPAAKSGDAKK